MVYWSQKALGDLDGIIEFYEEIDPELADRIEARIYNEIERLALLTTINKPVPGLAQQYRQWLVIDSRYRLYYEKLNQNDIKVLRIYSTKRKPLGSSEIL